MRGFLIYIVFFIQPIATKWDGRACFADGTLGTFLSYLSKFTAPVKKAKAAALDTVQIEQGIQKNIFSAPTDNTGKKVYIQMLRTSFNLERWAPLLICIDI